MPSGHFEEMGDWRFADHAPALRAARALTPRSLRMRGTTRMIERTMFGRAGFALLRRVLAAA
jgi:hypothetical protein